LPSRHDPADSVADIIENAERVESYLAGMARPAFERDGRTRDAVERCLERICEAAHRLGKGADDLMPGQPWGDIRGMGNRLRHAYDRVDLEIVWNTARDRLLALAAEARRALAQLRGPSEPGEPTDKAGA
jgi:uncharacterized protein with HEPN domain